MSPKFFLGDLQKRFFWWSPKKKVIKKFFQAICKMLTIQKIVLSSSRGQGDFWELEAKDFKFVLEAKNVLENSTYNKYRIEMFVGLKSYSVIKNFLGGERSPKKFTITCQKVAKNKRKGNFWFMLVINTCCGVETYKKKLWHDERSK